MRLPKIRKERHCLRPEVNRVFHFGKVGSSRGQFYEKFLSKIRLSDQPRDWSEYATLPPLAAEASGPDGASEEVREALLRGDESKTATWMRRVATPENYELWLGEQVRLADEVHDHQALDTRISEIQNTPRAFVSVPTGPDSGESERRKRTFRVPYEKKDEKFWAKTLSAYFGFMPDWKEGHIRGSYHKVLPFMYRGFQVYYFRKGRWPWAQWRPQDE